MGSWHIAWYVLKRVPIKQPAAHKSDRWADCPENGIENKNHLYQLSGISLFHAVRKKVSVFFWTSI